MALTPAANTFPDATVHVHVGNVIQAGAGPYQQDLAITPANLAAGTLFQRLDTLAYPQKGKKLTGTHPTTGGAVPATARPTRGAGS